MPLAWMMLSRTQRCSSKRFIFGSPTGKPSAWARPAAATLAAASGTERRNWRRCMADSSRYNLQRRCVPASRKHGAAGDTRQAPEPCPLGLRAEAKAGQIGGKRREIAREEEMHLGKGIGAS